MPIHFHDLDVMPELEGLGSALIVPCNMCPAITVALKEQRPFMNLLRSMFRSAPFEEYLAALQSRISEKGIRTGVFKSRLYNQWFMCMWTKGRQSKLLRHARHYDAVIVLGCESATETVRDAVRTAGCRVIEGMQTVGIMNAKLRFRLPGYITFDDCRVVPFSRDSKEENSPALHVMQHS